MQPTEIRVEHFATSICIRINFPNGSFDSTTLFRNEDGSLAAIFNKGNWVGFDNEPQAIGKAIEVLISRNPQ